MGERAGEKERGIVNFLSFTQCVCVWGGCCVSITWVGSSSIHLLVFVGGERDWGAQGKAGDIRLTAVSSCL